MALLGVFPSRDDAMVTAHTANDGERSTAIAALQRLPAQSHDRPRVDARDSPPLDADDAQAWVCQLQRHNGGGCQVTAADGSAVWASHSNSPLEQAVNPS